MHVRDGILSSEVCLATTALAVTAVGISWHQLRNRPSTGSASLTGAVAALIFAGQMVNFPLLGLPVSGHLLGGVLAAVLLGPWAGCLALTAVLIVQAVVFADGGLLSLGANVLNMAVVGCWGGGLLYQSLRRGCGTKFHGSLIAAVMASFVSVVAAAVLFGMEFSASRGGAYNLGQMNWLMLEYHTLIGLGEAVITGGILAAIWTCKPALLQDEPRAQELPVWGRLAMTTTAVGCGVAALLAPWASEFPDGLEAVGETLAFNQFGRDTVLLLPDYALPLPGGWEAGSVSAAGLLGVFAVIAVCSLLMWRRSPASET